MGRKCHKDQCSYRDSALFADSVLPKLQQAFCLSPVFQKKVWFWQFLPEFLVASIEGWSSAVSYSDHYIDIILLIFSYRNLGPYSCILRSSLYVRDINTLWLVANCFALVHHLVCYFVHGAVTYSNIFDCYQIY